MANAAQKNRSASKTSTPIVWIDDLWITCILRYKENISSDHFLEGRLSIFEHAFDNYIPETKCKNIITFASKHANDLLMQNYDIRCSSLDLKQNFPKKL